MNVEIIGSPPENSSVEVRPGHGEVGNGHPFPVFLELNQVTGAVEFLVILLGVREGGGVSFEIFGVGQNCFLHPRAFEGGSGFYEQLTGKFEGPSREFDDRAGCRRCNRRDELGGSFQRRGMGEGIEEEENSQNAGGHGLKTTRSRAQSFGDRRPRKDAVK